MRARPQEGRGLQQREEPLPPGSFGRGRRSAPVRRPCPARAHARRSDPKDLRYVATYMVKRRKDGPTRLPRHTPVAVMVTPLAPGSGLAAVTGWDERTGRWIPYPQFLLGLVKTAEIPEVSESR
ncbi:RNaseH domain-containing protein [Streptomyces sp. NPDC002671]